MFGFVMLAVDGYCFEFASLGCLSLFFAGFGLRRFATL